MPYGCSLFLRLPCCPGAYETPLDGALFLEAPLSLEEELHSFAAAKPT